jgi:hypothetical protein
MSLLAGRSKFSNSGKCGCFLPSPKLADWLLGPQSLVGSMYCPFSALKKRPGREPNNSRVPSAEVMMLSSKFPLVLRFQLNEQQQLKAVRVSGTDMYSKQWACGSSYGTALLVRVSVFRDEV